MKKHTQHPYADCSAPNQHHKKEHWEITKIYHEHDPAKCSRPCNAWDLITVIEGVQCSNCLALVIENKASELETSDYNEGDK